MPYSSIRMVWMRSLAIAILLGAASIGVDYLSAKGHPLILAQALSRESSESADFPDDVDISRLEANQLLYQGYEQYNRNEFQVAINSWKAALAQYQELGDRHLEATTLYCLQVVYDTQENFPMALDVIQQAEALGTNVDGCNAEIMLPNNWQVRFNLEYTAWWHEEIHDMQIAMPENPGDRRPSFFNLEFEEGSTSYYQNQIQSLGASLEDARQQGDRDQEMMILTRRGDVQLQMQQYDEADESYRAALAIAQQQDNHQHQTSLFEKLGIIYFILKDDGASLSLHQEQLQLAQNFGDLPAQAKALERIGSIHYVNHQYPEAMASYQQAVLVTQETGDREQMGRLLSKIGLVLDAQDQSELAIIFLKESVNIRQAIRQGLQGQSQSFRQHYLNSIADAYRRLADLLLQGDRVLEAQQVLDLLKIQELDDYFQTTRSALPERQELESLPPENQLLEQYNTHLTRVIALGQQLQTIPRNPDQRTPAQEQLRRTIEAEYEQIYREFLDFINTPEVQDVITQLRQTTEGQSLDPNQLIKLQEDLSKLGEGVVLLYPLVLEERLELILVTPYTPPIRRPVGVSKIELNEAILSFRQALNDPTHDVQSIAQRLYSWLIHPLEEALYEAGAQTIIYAPDGQLRYIPLAALYDGERWLSETYQINHITAFSISDWDEEIQELRVLAGAFGTQEHHVEVAGQQIRFDSLPYTVNEVQSLANSIATTTTLLDEDFSLDETKALMSDYSVLHLATHAAFVIGEPDESFILFGNGDRATFNDVAVWSFRNTDLVVLSACESGIGGIHDSDGHEILGFGYLMQQAGADAAIASLWQVSDGGTQVLMNAFYTALSNGYSKAEALQRAQQALITSDATVLGGDRGVAVEGVDTRNGQPPSQRGDLAHPYYWAPFILIGNGL